MEVTQKYFFALLVCHLLLCGEAFYVSVQGPVPYKRGQAVDVQGLKLTSDKPKLPYDFYRAPFCEPPGGATYQSRNLGEILQGDRIVNTNYKIKALEDSKCILLCDSDTPIRLTKEQTNVLIELIKEEYHVHLLVDNLPCLTRFTYGDEVMYETGYRLGFVKDGKYFLNNHLNLFPHYQMDDGNDNYIVGFEVQVQSWEASEYHPVNKSCTTRGNLHQYTDHQEIDPNGTTEVMFSFAVQWQHSDIVWAHRWDLYLTSSNHSIHWFSIINSLVVVAFVSALLARILVKVLRKDSKSDSIEEITKETRWKLIKRDVLRSPRYTRLLSVLLGSGIQIFCMTLIIIVLAALGLLSPANRGALPLAAVFLFVFMGLVAGYFSARIYRSMKGTQWKTAACATATLYPGFVLGCVGILNFFYWGQHSSGTVPITTMLVLVGMWLGISSPLIFIGYYIVFRKQFYQHQLKEEDTPRPIPRQKWYNNYFLRILIAGILPYGILFIEYFFILTAIWNHRTYYYFGFLLLVFVLTIVCVAQLSIVMIFFQLLAEDYHWWWKSFNFSGGVAVYVLGYSIFFFVTKLDITGLVPTLIYFGYSLLIAVSVWLVMGTVGFYAAYLFIRKAYSTVKIDLTTPESDCT